MTRRDYTDEDYGTCRYILENPVSGLYAQINEAGGSLTIARCNRLELLNLLDGVTDAFADGGLVRLAGLGVKTAEEAIRLQKASV